jgi:hypothetical protein
LKFQPQASHKSVPSCLSQVRKNAYSALTSKLMCTHRKSKSTYTEVLPNVSSSYCKQVFSTHFGTNFAQLQQNAFCEMFAVQFGKMSAEGKQMFAQKILS